MMANISQCQKIEHKLLTPNPHPRRVLFVVVSSNRGLCGSFNSSIAKFTESLIKEHKDRYEKMDFIFVGRKVYEYFQRRGVVALEFIGNLEKDISYGLAQKISNQLMDHYESGDYDEIRVVYNEFKSAISQDVVLEKWLPVDVSNPGPETTGLGPLTDMIFEPSADQIMDELLSKHFAVQMYRCLSESLASEHGARMTAMENSTKNAGELIKSLTTSYNKLRQAFITKELIEITTGAEALNG